MRVIAGCGNPASRSARRTASSTAATPSTGTRAITQPPKPPPVIRAPSAPAAVAVSAIKSMCAVVISKSSRMDACEAVNIRPVSAKSESRRAATTIKYPLVFGQHVAGTAGVDRVVDRGEGRKPAILDLAQR